MERDKLFSRIKELQEELKTYRIYLSEETDEDNRNRIIDKVIRNHEEMSYLRKFI